MPFWVWTWTDSRNRVSHGAWIQPEEGAISGGIAQPIVKHGEYPACDRYCQPYSVGGSSDVVFHCQYGSNLLLSLCSDLEHDIGHQFWMRLLARQKLSDHFVHHVLRWKEIHQECWKYPRNDTSLVRITLPYSTTTVQQHTLYQWDAQPVNLPTVFMWWRKVNQTLQ